MTILNIIQNAITSLPNEILWPILLLVNFLCVLFAYRIWGILGLYIWIPIAVIIANVQVLKTIELFGISATLGNIVYATSFLVTDILSENYGKDAARRAVGIGFVALIATTLIMNLALLFTPSAEDFSHSSLATIFSVLPRIAAASLLAYGLSQLHDIWAYAFWKHKMPSDKYIWLRNNASTMVSQLLDSAVFTLVAFLGVFEFPILFEIFLTTYILKWVVALLDTPFIYLAKRWMETGKIKERLQEPEVYPKV